MQGRCKVLVLALLAAACGGGEGGTAGPEVVGSYPIVSNQFANGGSFPCDTPLSDDTGDDALVVISEDDFGLEVETCNEAGSDCFPIIGLRLTEATEDSYYGETPSASSSGGLCSLHHVTSSLRVLDGGGLLIDLIDRYQSGDESNCDLAAAEEAKSSSTCTEVLQITTGPPR